MARQTRDHLPLLRDEESGEPSGDGVVNGSATHLNMLSIMSDRLASAAQANRVPSTPNGEESSPVIEGPPRGSSRRNRIDDLEDMMMMEAIRLSLASEEERRKREEKETAKDVKKKSKEDKKAEKAARKAGMYSSSTNPSVSTLESSQSGTFSQSVEPNGKGKATAREAPPPFDMDLPSSSTLARSEASPPPVPHLLASHVSPTTTFRPSHLRTQSNVSSSASSVAESMPMARGGSNSSFDASPSASGINISHPLAGQAEPLVS